VSGLAAGGPARPGLCAGDARPPHTLSLVITCAVALTASHARAGNDDEVLLGNDAALTSGAVTATTADGSAVWYNPAGIARADVSTLDVSGSAFVLRSYDIPELLASDGGEASDGSFVEFVTVPSALTFVRPVADDLHVGLGVFATQDVPTPSARAHAGWS
jgi:long-subunit fatty acid transport protein